MAWRLGLCVSALALVVTATPVVAADAVTAQMDAARAAFQKNDLPRTAQALEAALAEVQQRLGTMLAETTPPALAGWQADPAEYQGLGQAGGGLSVTRAYSKDEATLNASLFLDSPAVDAAMTLFANPAAAATLPHTKWLKVGGNDALLRYDPSTRTGEITMAVGNRVMLEIAGDNIGSGDPLTEAAKGWNVARIRALVGTISAQ